MAIFWVINKTVVAEEVAVRNTNVTILVGICEDAEPVKKKKILLLKNLIVEEKDRQV